MGALQHLHGDHHGVLEQIIVHHPIEDVDSSIITGTSEERELRIGVERDLTDGLIVVLKRLVWLLT